MRKILIDVRGYDDGGPTDRGYEIGTYWVPEWLKPIPWTLNETPEATATRVHRHALIERYLYRTYGVVGGSYHEYRIVSDVTKRLNEYRGEVERLTALLNEGS